MAEHNLFGVRGEAIAARYLLEKGFIIRECNWRSGHKEIDIVAQEDDVLVFVEVKTRSKLGRMQAQYAITPDKQRRMMESVRYYLAQHREHCQRMMRFDVVTVAADGICHLPNAFEGAAW